MVSLDRRWIVFLVVVSTMLGSSDSYKILMSPMVQKSHIFCMVAMAKELGHRGHETYILISDGLEIDHKLVAEANEAHVYFLTYVRTRTNATNLDMEEMYEEIARLLVTSNMSSAALMNLVTYLVPLQARELLMENEETIEKLKTIGFDIAVVDGMFATKYLHLLPHRLGIPWITYTDYPEPWTMRAPWLPSFVPGQFSKQTERMSFMGRVWNVVTTVILLLRRDSIVTLPEDILNAYQKYGHFRSYDELVQNSKFWLITSDFVLDYAKPGMPHIMEVGGLTAKPAKKLPEDVQSFLDGADDGVIVVSFGSMLSSYPDVLLRKFLDAFNRIQGYRIIWRLTNVSSEFQIPDFIRPLRWLSQNDILGHPKVKLFITHCGNNGQFEALYHGVPMIGFPIAGDQSYNAIRLEYRKFGIVMDIREFTSDQLYASILKILADPGYKRRISLASEIFRSAPQRPTERAAFWIEHVIKFGSDHLQSAGKDLNLFQYFLLDVLAAFLITGILLLIVLKQLVLWVKNKFSKSDDKMKAKMS